MSLSAFLAQNAAKVENVKYVASERFLDKNGEPIEWEIRAITSKEDKQLKAKCTDIVTYRTKYGQDKRKETNNPKYLSALAVACTVYPNLNDAELQDSYGVMGAEALLETMLTPGEYTDYTIKVQQVCGFETDVVELVEEAKN